MVDLDLDYFKNRLFEEKNKILKRLQSYQQLDGEVSRGDAVDSASSIESSHLRNSLILAVSVQGDSLKTKWNIMQPILKFHYTYTKMSRIGLILIRKKLSIRWESWQRCLNLRWNLNIR